MKKSIPTSHLSLDSIIISTTKKLRSLSILTSFLRLMSWGTATVHIY